MAQTPEVWTFDRLDRIGGHQTTVLGSPRVVETPIGKAVEFNGVDSALVVDVHPLAGAATFSWEAIFRPDGGEPAQRWLHDGELEWLWAEAEKSGVPIAALATDSLNALGRIAERHRGLRLTIDHLGEIGRAHV